MDAKKKVLSAEEIFAANDREYDEINVPEWGGVVRIRSMTGDELIKFNDAMQDARTKRSAIVRAVALCAVDADGERLFSEQDLERLRTRNVKVLHRIQKRFLELNGLGETAAAVEADLKND